MGSVWHPKLLDDAKDIDCGIGGRFVNDACVICGTHRNLPCTAGNGVWQAGGDWFGALYTSGWYTDYRAVFIATKEAMK